MTPQLTKGEIKTLQEALRKEIDIVMKNKISSTNIQKVADMIELILKLEKQGCYDEGKRSV